MGKPTICIGSNDVDEYMVLFCLFSVKKSILDIKPFRAFAVQSDLFFSYIPLS